jgi:pimeloyl-ACP methyl ester carboxylesterase
LRREVISFVSELDGTEQRAGLCGPDRVAAPLPLLVELEPGSINDLERTLETGQHLLRMITEPAVWLRPGGRGPGTVFQGPGEVDVFEAICAAQTHYSIDLDRISLYGESMGGAGVWYLASHYPDRFAAIAPFCGYNDYRLWTRPGGWTFPLFPWEEPSWQARSAIFLLENLRHIGIWIVHGAWDRAVGGGVDVAHSRNSAARLAALGIPYRYTEVLQAGHDARVGSDANLAQVLPWLVAQRRVTHPTRFGFKTFDLTHADAYWIGIRQFQRYGSRPASVSAEATPKQVAIATDNVRHLALGPAPGALGATALWIDGQRVDGIDLRGRAGLRRSADGTWRLADEQPPAGEKRPGLSGPFGDLVGRRLVLAPGTLGSDEETFFLQWCAEGVNRHFKAWNGGVHRGGIRGESWMAFPIRTDTAVMEGADSGQSVTALGTPATNALLRVVADRLPVRFGPGEIQLGDRQFVGSRPAMIAVLPHPAGGDRYLAVHGGTTPDAITNGAHLNWQLLPDYLIYDGDNVLDWGFFDNAWQLSSDGYPSAHLTGTEEAPWTRT